MSESINEQFDFTSADVAAYNVALAAATQAQRQAEAALAATGLSVYLPIRFRLDAGQEADVEALDPDLAALWATQIAYAIEHRIPIELIKPEQSGLRGTKYIQADSRTQTGATLRNGEDGPYLRFTIGY